MRPISYFAAIVFVKLSPWRLKQIKTNFESEKRDLYEAISHVCVINIIGIQGLRATHEDFNLVGYVFILVNYNSVQLNDISKKEREKSTNELNSLCNIVNV